jgi:hypothetical protein
MPPSALLPLSLHALEGDGRVEGLGVFIPRRQPIWDEDLAVLVHRHTHVPTHVLTHEGRMRPHGVTCVWWCVLVQETVSARESAHLARCKPLCKRGAYVCMPPSALLPLSLHALEGDGRVGGVGVFIARRQPIWDEDLLISSLPFTGHWSCPPAIPAWSACR